MDNKRLGILTSKYFDLPQQRGSRLFIKYEENESEKSGAPTAALTLATLIDVFTTVREEGRPSHSLPLSVCSRPFERKGCDAEALDRTVTVAGGSKR